MTQFFRDPDAFEALNERVFPAIVSGRPSGSVVRIWVAGCSTGEEVYSLAIGLLEYLDQRAENVVVKILATDLNEPALEKARSGLYLDNIEIDVTPARLRRFFVRHEGHYQISKSIREMCVFSRHNLTSDPPFSRLDLISCRNVLIYMDAALQKRVIPLLHYALNPNGFLFLGPSENVGAYGELFNVVDARHRIFERSPTAAGFHLDFNSSLASANQFRPIGRDRKCAPLECARCPEGSRQGALEPVCTGRSRGRRNDDRAPVPRPNCALSRAPARNGQPRFVSDAARRPVGRGPDGDGAGKERACLCHAWRTVRDRGWSYPHCSTGRDPVSRSAIGYTVFSGSLPGHFPNRWPGAICLRATSGPTSFEEQVGHLQQEIGALRAYLQSVIEEQESTNEELKSANEEILSANEELQSTNEELQTAKEEAQSANEELATVNDELRHRNAELGRVNNDLINLLSGVNFPIVMVGRDLRVRRFTPLAERVFNLIPSDVGRPN